VTIWSVDSAARASNQALGDWPTGTVFIGSCYHSALLTVIWPNSGQPV
jgi:hypothetical protein